MKPIFKPYASVKLVLIDWNLRQACITSDDNEYIIVVFTIITWIIVLYTFMKLHIKMQKKTCDTRDTCVITHVKMNCWYIYCFVWL